MSANPNTLRNIAKFRGHMQPAKVAVDNAIKEIALLMAGTAEVCIGVREVATEAETHPMMLGIMDSLLSATKLRGTLIDAHGTAGRLGRELAPELGWGDWDTLSPDGLLHDEAVVPLRVVS